jgi:hypothetical protein
MRNLEDTSVFRPALMGTISTTGATAIGAPIDTMGFAQVLAFLMCSAVAASDPSTSNPLGLAVKWQEAASPTSTGALWLDITNGAVSAGSFVMSTLTIEGTEPSFQFDQQSEILMGKDTNRLRYIRCHATVTGTTGVGIRFAVGTLLHRPVSSNYITSATTLGTGNSQYTWLK